MDYYTNKQGYSQAIFYGKFGDFKDKHIQFATIKMCDSKYRIKTIQENIDLNKATDKYSTYEVLIAYVSSLNRLTVVLKENEQ